MKLPLTTTIRIDDYPTGIRPVIDDFSIFFEMLEIIDSLNIPFYLGIVPFLLDINRDSKLKTYKNMIPAMHGYDHSFYKYSKILIANNDPFNTKTVGIFDEFSEDNPESTGIKIKNGKSILETFFNKKIDTYIPPCNILNEWTKKALIVNNFTRCLSESIQFNEEIEFFKSDFYGRSNELKTTQNKLITLHMTWEYDLIKKSSFAEWAENIKLKFKE